MAGEDPNHLAWLRGQLCAARRLPGAWCLGLIHAHHPRAGAGLGQRSHDHDALPLCMEHHAALHERRGPFRRWSREALRAWEVAAAGAARRERARFERGARAVAF